MSKYKLYGAKIKKDKIDSTGTTDQGQNIEPIIKEMIDSNLSTVPGADISNLQGVDVTGASNGDVLAYDQASGEWRPETVSGANITEGTLNTATTNRVVNLGGNNLTVTNGSHTFVSTNFRVNSAQSFLVGPDNQIYTDNGSGYFSRVMTTANYVQLANNSSAGFSAITVDNANTITIKSDAGLYKLGNNATSTPKSYNTLTTTPSNLCINGVTGEVFKNDTALQFLSSTQINATDVNNPTETEVLAFLQSLTTSIRSANLNRFFYYTGTTSDADTATHYYYLTGDEKLVVLNNSGKTFVVSNTVLNSPYSLSPTRSEIESYLNGLPGGISSFRDTFILYKYTPTSTFIVKTFYITSTDEVAELYEMYPYENVTFNTPIASIDSSFAGKTIGSIAVPYHLYVNGDRQIRNVSFRCVKDTSSPAGTNVASIAIKDEGGNTVLTFSIDSYYGGSGMSMGGTYISTSTNGSLFLEATSVTGNIDFLSVTMRVGA